MKKSSAKKILIILPFLALGGMGLTGCKSSSKARITYGTLTDNEATLITYEDLQLKIADKENMLIAVWQDSEHCSCWDTFKNVLDNYVKQYNTKVYYIARSQFGEGDDSFGLSLLKDTSRPTFAFIKEGKKANEYIHSNDTKPLFETVDGLRKAVEKIADDPQYFYVTENYLDNALFIEKQSKVIVHYIWHSCPDCTHAFPNVLKPYSEKNKFKTQVWLIDLEVPGLLLNAAGEKDKTNSSYVKFLKDHHMSAAGDEVFGYDRGFVPTTQIWENGELKDMNVYFNDTVSYVDGQYKVTQSYFSSERVQHLSYTNTVIEGITIGEEEVNVYESGESKFYSWKADDAAKKHKPLLEAFLDKYVK